MQGKGRLRHLDEFFFYTRDEILKTLEKDKKYQECRSDSERIARQFPIIVELLEGRKKGTTVELKEREQAAFREYVEIRRDMQDMVEREQYYRGHRDCLLYLLRSGIFEAE